MENTALLRQWLSAAINKSHPSDFITLTHKEDVFLQDLWMGGDMHERRTPSDIVFANTIPLKDCIIEVDERADLNASVARCRIVIFEKYLRLSDGEVIIGAVIPEAGYLIKNNPFYHVLYVSAGHDAIAISLYAKSELADYIYQDSELCHKINSVLISWLFTWYGIQIALLHPDVKNVFSCPTRQVLATGSANKTSRQRKTKYIRKHILTLDNLERAAHTNEAKKFNRRCLVWYVIGHWREYPSGKKVFIQPYWKGPLRQTRRNAEGDDRKRIIV